MNEDTNDRRDFGFLIGLLTGTFVGTGLALWFTPRAGSELRKQVTDSARELGSRASERYQQVTTRLAEAVDDLATTGRGLRNEIADRVAGSANEVERQATALKTEGVAHSKKRSATDRSGSPKSSRGDQKREL